MDTENSRQIHQFERTDRYWYGESGNCAEEGKSIMFLQEISFSCDKTMKFWFFVNLRIFPIIFASKQFNNNIMCCSYELFEFHYNYVLTALKNIDNIYIFK